MRGRISYSDLQHSKLEPGTGFTKHIKAIPLSRTEPNAIVDLTSTCMNMCRVLQ
jgi:hypothetical protein